ncbi:MAG: hypothetical protein HOF15_05555 [Planctomycetaceae bacterium]|nr:hypothetical protein [Planctomycetaceae bacterium]
MEKDPDKRYESCAALGEDLQAWLDHKPIQARPTGSLGKLLRWHKRNPVVANLTAGVAVVLILSAVVSVNFALTAQEEAKLARQARNRATASESAALESQNQAIQQKAKAEESEQAALAQKEKADSLAEDLSRTLYSSDMVLFASHWERGNYSECRSIIERHTDSSSKDLEWHYWNQMLRGRIRFESSHTGFYYTEKFKYDLVTPVAFSHDGKKIFGAEIRKVGEEEFVDLVVWDVATGKVIHSLENLQEKVLDAKGIDFLYGPQIPSNRHIGGKVAEENTQLVSYQPNVPFFPAWLTQITGRFNDNNSKVIIQMTLFLVFSWDIASNEVQVLYIEDEFDVGGFVGSRGRTITTVNDSDKTREPRVIKLDSGEIVDFTDEEINIDDGLRGVTFSVNTLETQFVLRTKKGFTFYDLESKQELASLFTATPKETEHSEFFPLAAVTEKYIAHYYEDGIAIWEIGNSEPLFLIRDYPGEEDTEVTAIELLQNPLRVAIALFDNSKSQSRVDIWNVSSKKKTGIIGGFVARVGQLAIDDQKQLLATTDGTVPPVVVSTSSANPLANVLLKKRAKWASYGGDLPTGGVSNNGRVLVSIVGEILTVSSNETKAIISRFTIPIGVQDVILSPTGSKVGLVYKNDLQQERNGWLDYHVDIWDVKSNSIQTTIPGRSLEISPDGKMCFQEYRNGDVVITSFSKDVSKVKLSNVDNCSWTDGGTMIVAQSAGIIDLYDPKLGEKKISYKLPGERSRFICVTVNEFAKLGVGVSKEKRGPSDLTKLVVFDLVSLETLCVKPVGAHGDVQQICVNNKGSRALIQYSNGVLALHDISTGSEFVQLLPKSDTYMRGKIGFNQNGTEILATRYHVGETEPLLEILHWDFKTGN